MEGDLETTIEQIQDEKNEIGDIKKFEITQKKCKRKQRMVKYVQQNEQDDIILSRRGMG